MGDTTDMVKRFRRVTISGGLLQTREGEFYQLTLDQECYYYISLDQAITVKSDIFPPPKEKQRIVSK